MVASFWRNHRYAINAGEIERELGWKPAETLDTSIHKTVLWYVANQSWVTNVLTGAYCGRVEKNYTGQVSWGFERSVAWNNPAIGIQLPIQDEPVLSAKHQQAKPSAEAEYFA